MVDQEQYKSIINKHSNEQLIMMGIMAIMSTLNCHENIFYKALMDEIIQRLK